MRRSYEPDGVGVDVGVGAGAGVDAGVGAGVADAVQPVFQMWLGP